MFKIKQLGNFVFGGLIGTGVDIVTGSIYKFDLKKLDVQLHEEAVVYTKKTPDGCFALLSEPSSNWELIGQLEKS